MAYEDAMVTTIEGNYDVLAIQSEARNLWYLEFDKKKKKVGILTINDGEKTCVVLTKKQAMTLVEEFQSILETVFE